MIDEALQDGVAVALAEHAHDASQVRMLGLTGASDEEVTSLALREGRVLVTTDTDFGTILALSGAAGPSVVLLRGVGDTVDERVAAILLRIPSSRTTSRQAPSLSSSQECVRLRRLPVDGGAPLDS